MYMQLLLMDIVCLLGLKNFYIQNQKHPDVGMKSHGFKILYWLHLRFFLSEG